MLWTWSLTFFVQRLQVLFLFLSCFSVFNVCLILVSTFFTSMLQNINCIWCKCFVLFQLLLRKFCPGLLWGEVGLVKIVALFVIVVDYNYNRFSHRYWLEMGGYSIQFCGSNQTLVQDICIRYLVENPVCPSLAIVIAKLLFHYAENSHYGKILISTVCYLCVLYRYGMWALCWVEQLIHCLLQATVANFLQYWFLFNVLCALM